jgi:hypothetical protein
VESSCEFGKAGRVAGMVEKRNAYRLLVGNQRERDH